MVPWIQNVSMADVRKGDHYNPGINATLIQIVDPDMEFPVPDFDFGESNIYQFKFLDIEEVGPNSIKQDDAEKIVQILHTSLDEGRNVVVHCVAGVSRSAAIVEIGILMGFRDAGEYRCPNKLVLRMLSELITQ